MGCAPMAHTLFSKVMRYNTQNPKWPSRDRFVLSNGHASALQYSMLHLLGYDLPMSELQRFRKLDAITAGHPENVLHPAIEVSTGPLGQGISNAVGMAMTQSHIAAHFNEPGFPVMDSFIYVICGDGCLQEGVSGEASSLAGHLGLGRLIVLYDDNKITIDGETHLSFTEDVAKRYEAYGWHVQVLEHGDNDVDGIARAIEVAKSVTDKPSLIKIATTIGFGSEKQGKEECHGAPLGKKDLAEVKRKFGFDPEQSFVVPEDVLQFYRDAAKHAATANAEWDAMFAKYAVAHPAKAAEFTRRFSGQLPAGWFDKLPRWKATDKADATRNTSGIVIAAIADAIPEIIGGSADLTPSNKTWYKGVTDYQKETPHGKYIRFGVREHAMAAIMNGMTAFGGVIPYGGTFLNFVGYAAGAVRLSALSHFRVIYVGTHDSIGLGEDGPTHQPVEMNEMLRATPNMYLYRPADGNETSAAYASILMNPHAPGVVALSRQNLPQLPGSSIEKGMLGGYTVWDSADPTGAANGPAGQVDLIVAATGSEVSIAIDGAKQLVAAHAGVRVQVVSLPCIELFEKQTAEYKKSVFPDGIPVLSVEASATKGWERYSHASIGMTTFGLSAPGPDVYKRLGITPEHVASKGEKLISHYGQKAYVLPVNAPAF
jgi:transketolase